MEDYKLIELIEQKQFSRLTESEKLFVENNMTKKEFEKQHLMLKKTKESYKLEVSKIPVNINLLEQLKQEKESNKKAIILGWLRYPIPSYSLVILGLLFFLVFSFQDKKTKEVIVYKQSSPIVLRDTIFKTDTIFKSEERIDKYLVNNNRLITKRKKSFPIKQNILISENEYVFDSKHVEEQKEKTGTSNSDRNDLAQFLGINI